jgi:glutamyl-tRNA synthetase
VNAEADAGGAPSRPELLDAAPVGRLAPSPTGLLHLGHARTFLLAWWSARSRGGRLLLRIEDLDQARSRAELADAARRDLEWLGIDWDGAPSVQSEHLERFDDAVRTLLSRGKAYACVCSRADLRTFAQAPHAGDSEPRYPGTCRDRYASVEDAERRSGRPASVRLRVPAGPVTLRDRIFGDFTTDVAEDVGDFLIARRGGGASYQLACAVDDAAEGVTEVVRGDDLLPSAARQWHVQEALGLAHPEQAHVPLVLDEGGRRLAKHEDDLSLFELRSRGVDPRRIVAWVAKTAGMAATEPSTARELLPAFDLRKIPKDPVRLGPSALAALFSP